MLEREQASIRRGIDKLSLSDLLPAMAACAGWDPGPDPTWDPDSLPDEEEPKES
jgi:hypothetical protein